MTITVNGAETQVSATRLDAVLEELGYTGAVVATAVNGAFIPRAGRAELTLNEGDALEVVAPLQGG